MGALALLHTKRSKPGGGDPGCQPPSQPPRAESNIVGWTRKQEVAPASSRGVDRYRRRTGGWWWRVKGVADDRACSPRRLSPGTVRTTVERPLVRQARKELYSLPRINAGSRASFVCPCHHLIPTIAVGRIITQMHSGHQQTEIRNRHIGDRTRLSQWVPKQARRRLHPPLLVLCSAVGSAL